MNLLILFKDGGQKKPKMCGGSRALSATTPTTLYRFKGKHPKILTLLHTYNGLRASQTLQLMQKHVSGAG